MSIFLGIVDKNAQKRWPDQDFRKIWVAYWFYRVDSAYNWFLWNQSTDQSRTQRAIDPPEVQYDPTVQIHKLFKETLNPLKFRTILCKCLWFIDDVVCWGVAFGKYICIYFLFVFLYFPLNLTNHSVMKASDSNRLWSAKSQIVRFRHSLWPPAILRLMIKECCLDVPKKYSPAQGWITMSVISGHPCCSRGLFVLSAPTSFILSAAQQDAHLIFVFWTCVSRNKENTDVDRFES